MAPWNGPNKAQITIMCTFSFMCKHTVSKWPSNSLKVTGNNAICHVHDFLLVFHCNYDSTLHHFRDIHLFPKI